MKYFALVSAIYLALSVALPAASPSDVQNLSIGSPAPDFSLPGIDGQKHQLADYKDAKVLMVAFISNHCPSSQAVEGRLKKLVGDYQGQGLAVIAINPNNPDGLRPDELGYSKYNDGFEDMKKHAAEQGFNFPYLYDGETQAVSKAYGCLATPHVFVFDGERKLRYKGYFDDSRFADPATVKKTAAANAVAALLAGQEVAETETRPHGCSTKWLSKKGEVAEDQAKWEKGTVEVEMIDTAGVEALRKNGTKKLRLVNVWATWCGPCVEEFPILAEVSRKFSTRDFELVTISVNTEDEKAEVKAFLEKKQAILPDRLKKSVEAEGRKTNSYIYSGANQDDLVKALDPSWPGPIPHSVLIAPDGKILWSHNGEVTRDELVDKVLEHLGRFYTP